MFIVENTKENTTNLPLISVHATRLEAVAAALESVGSDYANTFWSSKDGQTLEQCGRTCLDFSLTIYNGIDDLIAQNDEEFLPEIFLALAPAMIEYQIKAGLRDA